MSISFHQYADMLWGGTLRYVSPRPGMYIRFCPSCLHWRPLVTKGFVPRSEVSIDSDCVPTMTGTFTFEGTVPLVDAPNQPQLCLKCTERVQGQNDGLRENDLAEAQDALYELKSLVALIRVGFTPQEAGGNLGISE